MVLEKLVCRWRIVRFSTVWCVDGIFERTVAAGGAFTEIIGMISRCPSLRVRVMCSFWNVVHVHVVVCIIDGLRSLVFVECVFVWWILVMVCVVCMGRSFVVRSFVVGVGVFIIIGVFVLVILVGAEVFKTSKAVDMKGGFLVESYFSYLFAF